MSRVAAAPAAAAVELDAPACRSCGEPLERTFVDLGLSPLANDYLEPARLLEPETFHPLRAYVCTGCFLVQLPAAAPPEQIFGDYAYFSSYSASWLEHARRYAEQMTGRFGIGPHTFVVEVASNDGYLLRHFRDAGVPVLGIDPAANVAREAEAAGVPTLVEFFGEGIARRLRADGVAADLLVGNNVLAHVPDVNDFVAGLATLLAPHGVLTMEFPHLLRLIAETQFDTIYHEHFSYFSLLAVERVFARHGLVVFDVEELPTHGGSLRVYVRHAADTGKRVGPRIDELRDREVDAGLLDAETYDGFARRALRAKLSVLEFAVAAKREGRTIVGYGAAAKGNTLLNYCGLGPDLVDYVVDRSPHKQGRFLPGTRIPVHAPERVEETRPDYLLLLAWNLKDEIVAQMAHVRRFGCRFVTPVPEVRVEE